MPKNFTRTTPLNQEFQSKTRLFEAMVGMVDKIKKKEKKRSKMSHVRVLRTSSFMFEG